MSIPALKQVYDETRRLAIAGSVVASGDFRLKKLVPALEKAGKKAPVFAKVADAANRLIESDEKTSAEALLDLAMLVNAILYTQGETGVKGKLARTETTELRRPKTQASARVLKPLLEALTTTGSGRFEIIRDAYQRGAFGDLRLIKPALIAIDDTYSEISDYVARNVLPIYGRAIVPELRAKFDVKGRLGHARRLTLMHRLDSEGTRDLVQRTLEEGSKEVKIAAIGCLGDSPDDVPFLLEQAKARAKDVRKAAFKVLGRCDSPDAVKALCDSIETADLNLTVEPLRTSRNRTVTAAVLKAAEAEFETLLTNKKNKKEYSKQNHLVCLLLDCLRGRTDKKTEKLLLEMFAHTETLTTVGGEPSGKDVVERLVAIMAHGSPKVQAALIAAHETLPADSLGHAFLAATRSRKPAEVFDLFGPYLSIKSGTRKKRNDPVREKQEEIIELLLRGREGWYCDRSEDEENESDTEENLDPRWLDRAIELDQIDLVRALAVPGHAAANEMLSKLFKRAFSKPGDNYELIGVLDTMVRVRHPEATDAMIDVIKKNAKKTSGYHSYWLSQLIPRLPKEEALPKLEALLATLPEKASDRLVDPVAELKYAG